LSILSRELTQFINSSLNPEIPDQAPSHVKQLPTLPLPHADQQGGLLKHRVGDPSLIQLVKILTMVVMKSRGSREREVLMKG